MPLPSQVFLLPEKIQQRLTQGNVLAEVACVCLTRSLLEFNDHIFCFAYEVETSFPPEVKADTTDYEGNSGKRLSFAVFMCFTLKADLFKSSIPQATLKQEKTAEIISQLLNYVSGQEKPCGQGRVFFVAPPHADLEEGKERFMLQITPTIYGWALLMEISSKTHHAHSLKFSTDAEDRLWLRKWRPPVSGALRLTAISPYPVSTIPRERLRQIMKTSTSFWNEIFRGFEAVIFPQSERESTDATVPNLGSDSYHLHLSPAPPTVQASWAALPQ